MKTRNEKIIARAKAAGSMSTTFKGAAKFLLAKKITPTSGANCTRAQFLLHSALDAGKLGDSVIIPDMPGNGLNRIHGYRCFALSDEAAREAAYVSMCEGNPRKKNVYRGNAKVSGPDFDYDVEAIHYRGNYKGYTGSSFTSRYQSAICLSRSGRTAVQVTGNVFMRRLRAPAGMRFEKNNNGVLLRRVSDQMDYHPTHEDLRAADFATRVRKAMADNFRKRVAAAKAERQVKIDKAEVARIAEIKALEIGSVRVTLEDSRRAGNCVEGSLAYAERKLSVSRDEIISGGYLFSVPAMRVLAANGEAGAQRAVDAAWLRETTIAI